MIVNRSKLVSERITLTFSFVSDMAPLETITSHELICEVLIGEDDHPEDLLWQSGAHTEQEVTHQVHRGVPGVIYQFLCTVVTSSSKTLQRQTKLAILPAPAVIPPLWGVTYTTHIYPAEVLEVMQGAFSNLGGRLREMPFPLEMMSNSLVQLSGTLRELLQTYTMQPEYMQNAMGVVSGTLEVKLITYSIPYEAMQNSLNITNGTLEVKLIEHTQPAETMQNGFVQLSGTLV